MCISGHVLYGLKKYIYIYRTFFPDVCNVDGFGCQFPDCCDAIPGSFTVNVWKLYHMPEN